MAAQKKAGDAVPSEAPRNFDERLERLELIVSLLEGGDLTLEQSIERYREGASLLATCRGELESFRAQVQEIGLEVEAKPTPYAKDPDMPAARTSSGRDDRPA